MSARRYLLFSALLALALLVGWCAPAALARLELHGMVEIYNPVTGQYEPATGMRLRAVLWEYADVDTADVETTVRSDASYSMTISGPWLADGYGVKLLAFAENSGVFEIQSHYMQYDGYQALSSSYYAPDGKETVKDLRIGGPRSTVASYQVGGVSGVFADRLDTHMGESAFFLFREASSFRYDLAARAFATSQFEEKEITFATDVPDGRYTSFYDYIQISSLQSPQDLANTIRHELAHALMADMYPSSSSIFSGGPSSHYLYSEETPKFAWTEGWAEFMAEATRRMKYRPGAPHYYNDANSWGNDLEATSAGWTQNIQPSATGYCVEGQVAASLYDIFDGTGWEKRRVQTPEVPGDEMFFDGIADPDMRKIESIASKYKPTSFYDDGKSQSSFLAGWFRSPSYGQKHELKTICFNRQILLDSLPSNKMPERAPEVQIRNIEWRDGNKLSVECSVSDADPEDRPFIWLELFVNDSLAQRVQLSEPTLWKGKASCVYTFTQEVAWAKGDANPKVLVHANDEMLSSFQTRAVDAPQSVAISRLQFEVLGVTWRNNLVQAGDNYGISSARTVVEILGQSGQKVSGARFFEPAKGAPGWQIPAASEFVFAGMSTQTVNPAGQPIHINFYAEANYGEGAQAHVAKKGVVAVFPRAENYGLGTRTIQIPLVVGNDPGFSLVCEVAYTIRSSTQASLQVASLFPPRSQVAQPFKEGSPTPTLVKLTAVGTVARAKALLARQDGLQLRVLELAQELEAKLRPSKEGARALATKPILGERLAVQPNPFMKELASKPEFYKAKAQAKNAAARLAEMATEVDSILAELAVMQKSRQQLVKDLNTYDDILGTVEFSRAKSHLQLLQNNEAAFKSEATQMRAALEKLIGR